MIILTSFIFITEFAIAKIIKSKYGNPMVSLDGYHFTLTKDKRRAYPTPRQRWTCSNRVLFKCKAKVFTIGDRIVRCFNEHTHFPKEAE